MKYIVCAGNVVQGLTFYGPFNVKAEAVEWAKEELPHDSWHTAALLGVPE